MSGRPPPAWDGPSFADTLAMAREWHGGQFDWSGVPYWRHPLWVACRLPPSEANPDALRIALLHDALEDCADQGCTEAELRRRGFPERVVSGVVLLTREDDGGLDPRAYGAYVARLAASGHRAAMWVKICDGLHNTLPSRRASLPPERLSASLALDGQYLNARRVLSEELGISWPLAFPARGPLGLGIDAALGGNEDRWPPLPGTAAFDRAVMSEMSAPQHLASALVGAPSTGAETDPSGTGLPCFAPPWTRGRRTWTTRCRPSSGPRRRGA